MDSAPPSPSRELVDQAHAPAPAPAAQGLPVAGPGRGSSASTAPRAQLAPAPGGSSAADSQRIGMSHSTERPDAQTIATRLAMALSARGAPAYRVCINAGLSKGCAEWIIAHPGQSPKVSTVEALAKALGVDPGWLAFGAASSAPPLDAPGNGSSASTAPLDAPGNGSSASTAPIDAPPSTAPAAQGLPLDAPPSTAPAAQGLPLDAPAPGAARADAPRAPLPSRGRSTGPRKGPRQPAAKPSSAPSNQAPDDAPDALRDTINGMIARKSASMRAIAGNAGVPLSVLSVYLRGSKIKPNTRARLVNFLEAVRAAPRAP